MKICSTLRKNFIGNARIQSSQTNPHFFRVHSYIIIPQDEKTRFKIKQLVIYERNGGNDFKVYLEGKSENFETWISKREII